MKKLTLLLLVAILSTGCVAGIVKAQSPDLGSQYPESLTSHTSNVTVNTDNSIDVVETIIYNTGPQQRHGIYRDIYTYSSQNRKMSIENVSVVDGDNNPYQFQVSDSGDNVRVKIGDPNQTFTGQKIYSIRYHATNAVAQLKDVDEIYWNSTGNEWNIPIYQAGASVGLPAGASMIQSACYYGPKGSTNKCQLDNSGKLDSRPGGAGDGSYSFKSPSALNPNEGLTVAVGFQKGIVTPYSASDGVPSFFERYWRWFVAGILPLLTLIFSLMYWYKKGRDDRPTGTIIPQYDVPDGLTPMEVGGIVSEKVDASNISAEIIYLATKGYLKINQIEKKTLGFIKSTDYELIRLKEYADLPNDFDQKLMSSLFNVSSQSVQLSDLRNVFYIYAAMVVKTVLNALLSKGYYKNLGKMKGAGNRIGMIVFMSFWASMFLGGIFGNALMGGQPFPLMVGIFVSIVIYGIISYFSPAKTDKGVTAKEYLLGLKDYLQIAEKDRLQFHNAPDKRPEVFEKLLPYAMILGVASIWAKEFEGIYTTPPSWYSGPSSHVFSAIAFSNSMSSFSSFASSSLTSAPGRGGSGGGGSSGGGGGGGGGGGW